MQVCAYISTETLSYSGEWHHELRCGRQKQQNPVRRDLDDKKSGNREGSRIG